MELKTIYWDKGTDVATAQVLGYTLVAVKDGAKWQARLLCGYMQRPEVESNFDTATEAMRYAEHVLLAREIRKFFKYVGGKRA